MDVHSLLQNWIVKNLLKAFVLVFALVIAAAVMLAVLTKHGKEIVVPDLTGMSVPEASAYASRHDMRADVTDSVYVRRMAKGTIYRQNPPAGSHVKKGRRIALTINAVTAKKVTMPNLVGYSMRQAKAELLSRGLKLGRLIYVNDIATNNVLKQLVGNHEIDPGTSIESETEVDLVVGLNESDNLTCVPDVLGMRMLGAVDAIHDNSLNVKKLFFDETVKDYNDSLSASVYRQSPGGSSDLRKMGGEVSLYLTKDIAKLPAR